MHRFLTTELVDVYHFSLAVTGEEEAGLLAVLDPAEAEHARGFPHARDRRRFAVGRGRLRQKLGERLSLEAHEVQLQYGRFGKPKIDPNQLTDGVVHFNLAHSGELALLGLSEHGPVGVDVEQATSFSDMEVVAQRVFSSSEYEEWSTSPLSSKRHHFFSLWTKKEAVLKVLGLGLSLPPRKVEVGLEGSSESAEAPVVDGERRSDLSVTPLELADGYLGALALKIPRINEEGGCATSYQTADWSGGSRKGRMHGHA